jgi:putative aldouronate transport system substrate-binding protein
LVDQETEVCLSIITGQKPLEAYDEYIANWKAAGGEQVVAEVNEWWQSVQ